MNHQAHFATWSHYVVSGWTRAWDPASASQVLGLQTCTSMPILFPFYRRENWWPWEVSFVQAQQLATNIVRMQTQVLQTWRSCFISHHAFYPLSSEEGAGSSGRSFHADSSLMDSTVLLGRNVHLDHGKDSCEFALAGNQPTGPQSDKLGCPCARKLCGHPQDKLLKPWAKINLPPLSWLS
jgi:hypothetical protein